MKSQVVLTKSEFNKMVSSLSKSDILFLDTEATDLDPYKLKPLTIQLADRGCGYFIPCNLFEIDQLKDLIENRLIVGAGLKFDWKLLKHHYNIEINNLWDLVIIEKRLTQGTMLGCSLKDLTNRYLNKTMDKSVRKTFTNIDPGTLQFSIKHIEYALNDVLFLPKIYDLQKDKIQKNKQEVLAKLENDCVPVLANAEYKGIFLSSDKLVKLENEKKEELIEIQKKLADELYKINPKLIIIQQNLFEGDTKISTIDWNSPKQVLSFCKWLKFDVETWDAVKQKTKESIEEKTLVKNYGKGFDNWIDLYLKFKELRKDIDGYGTKFLKHINSTSGRVHTNYNQVINTGRLSSNNPNLQNIKSESGYRKMFEPRKGYCFITADYSQMEPRLLADASKDKEAIDFYINGDGDSHSYVTNKMYSVILGKETNVTKKSPYLTIKGEKVNARHIGKTLNLKIGYGGTAYTIKDTLKVSEQEAQKFINALVEAFPMREKYYNWVYKKTLENGYILINNITNARRYTYYIKKIKEGNYKYVPKLKRLCMNSPIQGTGADIVKLAMVKIHKRIKDKDADIILQIHDELVIECKKDIVDTVSKIVKEEMENAGKVFCKQVKMPVEIFSGQIWNH